VLLAAALLLGVGVVGLALLLRRRLRLLRRLALAERAASIPETGRRTPGVPEPQREGAGPGTPPLTRRGDRDPTSSSPRFHGNGDLR
jgi:hypothetical protein